MLATTMLIMLAPMLLAAHMHDVRGSGHHHPHDAVMLTNMLTTTKIADLDHHADHHAQYTLILTSNVDHHQD
jgi:hypothetical protein